MTNEKKEREIMTTEEKQQELEHNIRKLYNHIAEAFFLLARGQGQNASDIAWELIGSYETLHQAQERKQENDSRICFACGDIIEDNQEYCEYLGHVYHGDCAYHKFGLYKGE